MTDDKPDHKQPSKSVRAAAGRPAVQPFPEDDPNEEPICCASPPCYAGEIAPGYFLAEPPLATAEILDLLNTLLAAERAGAKTIAHYLKDLPAGPAKAALQATGRDEGRYTVMLTREIERLGGNPTRDTGSFYDKAIAIDGLADRLAFLNRGQGWVARKLGEVVARIPDANLAAALTEMRDTHLTNIRTCEEIANTLASGESKDF